jgi:predicted HTH domain antitoxin
MSRSPQDMSVGELRRELKERGIKWTPREGQADLAKKLEGALAPA